MVGAECLYLHWDSANLTNSKCIVLLCMKHWNWRNVSVAGLKLRYQRPDGWHPGFPICSQIVDVTNKPAIPYNLYWWCINIFQKLWLMVSSHNLVLGSLHLQNISSSNLNLQNLFFLSSVTGWPLIMCVLIICYSFHNPQVGKKKINEFMWLNIIGWKPQSFCLGDGTKRAVKALS